MVAGWMVAGEWLQGGYYMDDDLLPGGWIDGYFMCGYCGVVNGWSVS